MPGRFEERKLRISLDRQRGFLISAGHLHPEKAENQQEGNAKCPR
jgi:hypothetical protein